MKNTARIATARTLKRDDEKNTAMCFSIELGPYVSLFLLDFPSNLAVTKCSIFGRLRDMAEVTIESNCFQPGSNVEKMMKH